MGRGKANVLQVAKYPLDMTLPELRAAFAGETNAGVMRALVLAEVQSIREGAQRDQRTLRGFWYDYIKPILSRLGLLNTPTKNGKDIDWDGMLSKYLAQLVRDGQTTYNELAIVDGSRQRRVARSALYTVADVTLIGARYPWLILFTEKDTIWDAVDDVASLYGVSAISGGGQPSAACTANVIEAIVNADTYHGHGLTLLSLTDYDPAGYNIAASQYQQIVEAAPGHTVQHVRLGLTPDQLTPEERRIKTYEPKDVGLESWYAQTGGVDGLPLGLELDALGLQRIRAMFAAGIEQFINLVPLRTDLRRAYVDLLAWQVLLPQVEKQLDTLRASVWDSHHGQAINSTVIPDELFMLAARQGWNTINPLRLQIDGKPLFGNVDDVLATMIDALKADDQVEGI